MKNLKELRAERAAKAKRGREATIEFNTLGATESRSAEQETRLGVLATELEALESDVVALDATIAAEEASARRSGLFSAAAPAALQAHRPSFLTARTIETDPSKTGGFKSMNEFAHAVVNKTMGVHDERLSATQGTYNASGGSSGEGFLVPPEYSQQIWDIAFDNDDLFGMCQPEPTSSNAVLKPKDESTPWGAVGVQAQWRSAGSQLTPTKLNVTGELMTLHELYAFCAATNEVISDAPMLQNRLTFQAGRAIKWQAADSVMWGDGNGKPKGFMLANSLVTVPKDAAQTAKTLSVNNLAGMASHVLRVGGKPMWIANPDVMPQLVPLTIGNIPAYLPNNQPLAGDPYDGHLLGYPILFSEHGQTLGTTGDIVCCNLAGGYYAVNKAEGVEAASSIHLYFDQNLTAFRWTFRLTGQPYLSAAIQPARGATAKSHFVALATRA